MRYSTLYIILYILYAKLLQKSEMRAKLLQKSEMRKDIVIELSYKGFG